MLGWWQQQRASYSSVLLAGLEPEVIVDLANPHTSELDPELVKEVRF